MEEMFKKGIIFVNDIINRTGGVVTHAANTDIWKCLLYPKLQPTNCRITTKMEAASRRGKKVSNLYVGPALKNMDGKRKV